MALNLVAGPAHAGKVALLLERYLAVVDRDPFLVVPIRSDVEAVEHDLLSRAGCLTGGSIGTFDDLFARIAGHDPFHDVVLSDTQRALLLRRVVADAVRNDGGIGRSSRFSGFTDALAQAIVELESGLLEPADLDGDLATLYAGYRSRLAEIGRRDRELVRIAAVRRLESEFDAWNREPVFAYGFEDLTAAEWSVLTALAGRTDVTVSLPYEPGRAAFASLQRTVEDLASLADGRIEELPPRRSEGHVPALVHLERQLFVESPHVTEIGGAIRFLEGAGTRGTLELVAEEILRLIRDGMAPEEIGVIAPAPDTYRAPLETVFGSLGIPYAVEVPERLSATAFGHALIALLRFAWGGGTRRELFTFMRSPFSGVSRTNVDFVEGRLRGRAIDAAERVEAETERLREAPLVALRDLRDADTPLAGATALVGAMLRFAYRLETPPVGETARSDLRAHAAALTVLRELQSWADMGEAVSEDDVVSSLERCTLPRPSAAEPGRVAVLDLLRARTRAFGAVFVLGLEEGSLPRRGRMSPFLDDDKRRELGRRLERPDQASRDRYLFYTACTRPTKRLYLVREAASDEGTPREASPFWHDVRALFDPDDVARSTVRRSLAAMTWPLDAAPTERERLRALARLAAEPASAELADALAYTNGWDRRLRRARRAFEREARLKNPAVLAQLGSRSVFAATELERFADCSSAWFFERLVSPKTVDAEADAMLRGSVAHQALYKLYSLLPKELGSDRVTPENLPAALELLERCLAEALHGGVRIDLDLVDAAELRESLRRDLRRFLHDEAESKVEFLPRKFEVGFGSERSAPELQRGLDLGDGLAMSGKIDRIDVDPYSARGIVQDYKTGKGAFSARQIDDERRLQVPLYMLVLRDLVGIEPLGGVYRSLAGARATRGMLRAESSEDLPGFSKADYLDEETFWAQVETARDRARGYAQRIRHGDVQLDPKGGECPPWCDLWTMCRTARS
ncbi:MAG: hypothetical protein F2663_03770 [Actinobacteria bacterium]|uniref:Unannotated protein n=1 Tax=freshwater metagenome TaxID=449393 RepID=A0A6J6P4V0_9ZZZZ|nr:hypothetical protein [Actinomycetota bacterium]